MQTITDATATSTSFEFITDSLGTIIGWDVKIDGPLGEIKTQNTGGTTVDEDFASGGNSDTGGPNGIPGTWSVATTPLPATLPLFAGGLAAIGLLGRRRRKSL